MCSTEAMKTCLIIIGWFLITVATATEDPTKSCKWIYKCCEEVAGNCVRVCDSEIVCKDLVNNQDESLGEIVAKEKDSDLEVTTTNITTHAIIDPKTCRKGFKRVQSQCKRVF